MLTNTTALTSKVRDNRLLLKRNLQCFKVVGSGKRNCSGVLFASLKFFFFFYKTPVLLPRKCWYLAVFKCTEAAVGVYLSVTCGLRAHWLLRERPSLSCCHDRFVCLCVWLRCPQVRPRDSALTFDLFAWQNMLFLHLSRT